MAVLGEWVGVCSSGFGEVGVVCEVGFGVWCWVGCGLLEWGSMGWGLEGWAG